MCRRNTYCEQVLKDRILTKVKTWEMKDVSNDVEYQEYTCCFNKIPLQFFFYKRGKEERKRRRERRGEGWREEKREEGRKNCQKG